MKLTALFTGMMLLCTVALSAQEWIDMTDSYVVNPRFDGNQTAGWTWNSNAGSQTANYEGFEFWNGDFDIQQRLHVPAGKYRVSVQAYYRPGDNQVVYASYKAGEEFITASLYANDQSVPLKSIYSEPMPTDIGGCWTPDNVNFFPDNMYSGSAAFASGMYPNQVEVEVGEDGQLVLGISGVRNFNGNWCMMDNFKLEMFGTVIKVTSVKFPASTLSMVTGENTQLSATVEPENATFKKLEWKSLSPDVASVDNEGNIEAKNSGVAIIKATSTDGTNLSATCAVIVKDAVPTAETVIINEIQNANLDMFVDPSFNYGSWVELYNPTANTVSLKGAYISDDPDNLKKHRLTSKAGLILPKGYAVLWFDHFSGRFAPGQIDNKLDYEGGTIYISDPNGKLISSQTYPEGVTRTSYARTTDGGMEWGITMTPTPGKSNNGSPFATVRLEDPVVDKDACLFTSAFDVQVAIPAGATLRYTTDGTTPTENNGFVSRNGHFTVDYTTTFRFRLFQDGYLPSRVITRSYLYMEESFGLPVVSVVTDPANLYDDYIGIMVRGVNGRTGNGQSSPCNWNMDWERPVNFEYINAEGEMVVNMEANMEMCGGWSRAFDPHSFKIKANKIYEGENYIPYPIFPNKAYMKHKTLQIRNGGNDIGSRIKDAALQTIVHTSGLDVDGQECQPVIHFINGEYKGLLNIREPNNKHFVEANYALDDDEIDQFEMSPDSGYVQKCGTDWSFTRWYELSANAANNSVYEEICGMVDIDEYINYMAVEFYLGSNDWPQNNLKAFKPRMEGGKFRFVLFDVDHAFNSSDPFNLFFSKKNYTFDLIYDTNSRLTAEIKLVTIFQNMLKNGQFRKKFIDTFCLVAGSVFVPERCDAIIDSMARNTERALSYEYNSPWGTANDLKRNLRNRQQQMIYALKEFYAFNLSGVKEQKVALASTLPQARLMVNGMEVPTGKFNGSLFAPITLKAVAPAGHRFVGWTNGQASEKAVFEYGSTWNYYDQGSQDGQNWKSAVANGWKTGDAPLGYYTSDYNNGRGYKTILDYGNDGNKRPTYYFTKEFTLNNTPTEADVYTLSYTVDDGMVVYINGQEAARYLMHGGAVGYHDYASSYASGNPDVGALTLPAGLFKKGKNVIAVEVHNNNGTSTDIYFDAALTVKSPLASDANNLISTDEEIQLPSGDRVTLTACYEPIPEEEMLTAHNVPVRINEVSAENSIYVAPTYFKKNDWIELYNTTNKPVDVAGMYLTDKETKPNKYQIPADAGIQTVIQPHGYLVVWADKLEPVQQLHTQFKLDNEGGCVMLTAADNSWCDILRYPQHAGSTSVGLYPDGGMQVYLMNTPTIAAANFITSYSEYLAESEIPHSLEEVELPEGASLYACYAEGSLIVVGNGDGRVSVALYTTSGQRTTQLDVVMTEGRAVVPMNNLSAGIYLVHMQDEHGHASNQKIVVR